MRVTRQQYINWTAQNTINDAVRDLLEYSEDSQADVDTSWLSIRIVRILTEQGYVIKHPGVTKQEEKDAHTEYYYGEHDTMFVRGSNQTRGEQAS